MLKSLFTPPKFEDEAKTQAAAIPHVMVMLLLISIAVSAIPTAIFSAETGLDVALVFLAIFCFVLVVNQMLHRGYVYTARHVLIIGIGVMLTVVHMRFYGAYTPTLGAFGVLILLAGIVIGQRAAILSAIYSIGLIVASGVALYMGWLPPLPDSANPFTRAIIHSVFYVVTAVILYVALGQARDAIQRLRKNEQVLTDTLNNLRTTSFSKNYMDNLLRSMSNLVIVTNAQGNIVKINAATNQILGYEEHELLGQPLGKLTKPDAPLIQTYTEDDLTKSRDTVLQSRFGQNIPISYTLSLLNDASPETTESGFIFVAQDITERHQAELERQRDERRYRSLFEQTNDAVFLIALNGNYINANQRASEMLGYPHDQLLKLRNEDVTAPSEHSKSDRVIQDLMAGKTVPAYERILQRSDGTNLTVEISIELVYDTDGKPLHIQSIARDITERKRHEQQLRYQANLLENVSDAIISTDRDGIILSWNHAAEKVYGWQAHEVIGQPISRILPTITTTQAPHSSASNRLQDAPHAWETEVTQAARNGRKLTMIVSGSLIHDADGNMTGAVYVNHDITARQQAEADLKKHVEQLAALRQVDVEINTSLKVEDVLKIGLHGAYLLSDAGGGMILLEEGGVMVLRHALNTCIDYPRWNGYLPKDDPFIANTIATQEPALNFMPMHDQNIIGTRSRMVFPLNSGGRPVGVLYLESHDPQPFSSETFDFVRILASRITIALDNARLYQEQQLQYQELREVHQHLQAAEEFKLNIIKLANHDLGNAIIIASGNAELLQEDLKGALSPDLDDRLNAVIAGIRRVDSILKEMLSSDAMRRLSRGKQRINLSQLTKQVFGECKTLAFQKQQQIDYIPSPTLLFAEADPIQIRQVMYNLIENAVKYTPPRGKIKLRLQTEGERVRFEVEDNGFGIPADKQADIFQANYRVQDETTEGIPGTGMGLHLINRIIKEYGGSMYFTSTYRKGSTFGFELPLS